MKCFINHLFLDNDAEEQYQKKKRNSTLWIAKTLTANQNLHCQKSKVNQLQHIFSFLNLLFSVYTTKSWEFKNLLQKQRENSQICWSALNF